MSNRQKLLDALAERKADPRFGWLLRELEYYKDLNEEREAEDKCADDAEVFMLDIADKADDPDTRAKERGQIREVLIAAGFYVPFDEKAWKAGRIAISRGKPWDFSLKGVKYEAEGTFHDFLEK